MQLCYHMVYGMSSISNNKKKQLGLFPYFHACILSRLGRFLCLVLVFVKRWICVGSEGQCGFLLFVFGPLSFFGNLSFFVLLSSFYCLSFYFPFLFLLLCDPFSSPSGKQGKNKRKIPTWILSTKTSFHIGIASISCYPVASTHWHQTIA